jgi:hypothetical protein
MAQVETNLNQDSFFKEKELEMQQHQAWHGLITGMFCEGVLRDREAFTYILRQGERPYHYYLSFVKEDGTFHHQPFVVELKSEGWFYRNFNLHYSTSLEGIIPKIMHCSAEQGVPLTKEQCSSPFYSNYSS